MSTTKKYFQSYEDYFWHYEDSGKVIAVPHGHTLGYSDHIQQEIITYLAPQGLPKFGALLLALAATNSQGSDTLENILNIVKRHTTISHEINEGLWFAKLLTHLPARYKKGNQRLELLRGIFSKSHNSVGIQKSLTILAEIKSKVEQDSDRRILTKIPITESQIVDDFRTLSIIGRELNSIEAIMNRLTSLPKIENDLNFELEKQNSGNGLLEQLIEKNKTFHVGALVSILVSGLHIPFHSSLPSEQPLGGVADITNKGNFDKLLMSEYAYDDYVLMSRLANNESLYHHREAPPSDNNYSRVILIDTTLKNWGTIRTISFAVMLAITNHPKNRNPCRVFLVGKSYKEIKLETVDDIIDGLQELDSSLDPGVGLMELFSTEQIKVSEIFFVGSMDVLKCAGMQQFNTDFGKRIDHWIHPNEQGEVSIYKNPKRGKRFIQALKLPLDELWTKSKRNKNKEITIYVDYEYPILFAYYKFKVLWTEGKYTYGVTKNKALLRCYVNDSNISKGWQMVTSKFAPSDILKAVITHNDLTVTVLVSKQTHEFELVNFPSGERIPISNCRQLKHAREFYIDNNCFRCLSHSKTCYINLQGEVTEEPARFRINPKESVKRIPSNVYQNIKQISITNDNELRIGKQDLILEGNNIFLRHEGHKKSSKINANQPSLGYFIFPDGSTLLHNRNGMLVLTSSNKSIPEIFIPCVLNVPLGVATTETFSGHSYFQMNYKYEILFHEIPENKLTLIKLVKESLGSISLAETKEMVDRGLIISPSETKMRSLEEQLNEMGFSSYSLRERGIKQEVIKAVDFYKKYIQEFINHIVNHATNTN